MATTASASDASTAGDKAELEVLRARLEKLETKMASQEATAAGAEPGNAIIQLPSGLHGVQMGGYVDTSYTYNFNEPTGRTNAFRALDTQSGSFMLNQAKLFLAKPVSSESPVGFRTDLIFGTDAEVLSSVETGLGTADNEELDIQQGYVEYLAPLGNGLDVKVGKFPTLHGAEVTESKDNWNFSRSFSWLYAEPLTHTGIRLHYPITDTFMAMAGVSNGWDVVDDNNKAKSLEFGFTATPVEGVSVASSYMVGSEQASDSRDQRHFFSTVIGWDPIDRLHLKFGYDYGHEEDVVSEASGGNGSWQGIIGYAKYDLTDKWSVAGRVEVFNDNDGIRTGVNTDAGGAGVTGSAIHDLQLVGYTLTNEYKFNEHLIGRFEYRLDTADNNVFAHDQTGGFENYQNTVAFEFIAPF